MIMAPAITTPKLDVGMRKTHWPNKAGVLVPIPIV